jgi:ribosomal protein S18 acetylase RimI-like enzyme
VGLRHTSLVAHSAQEQEIPRVIEILADSFYCDPTWSWAFPDPGRRRTQLTRWWGLYLRGARVNKDTVWVSENLEAASVWFAPGAHEFTPEQEALVEPLFVELVGTEQAGRIMALMGGFEEMRPKTQPHYYLSFLGTHTDHRGHGIGFSLLADNLAWVDTMNMPAYLEASNPANVALYQRYGFERVGEFTVPDGPTLITMWRPAAN